MRMNNTDALKALQDYYDLQAPTADDEFKFTEIMNSILIY